MLRRTRAIAVALLLAPGAHGANLVVTTTADPAPSGCGLRDAIVAANGDIASGGCAAGSGADVIDLTGLTGTIHLGGGLPPAELPALVSDVTIRGPGADRLALNGDGNVRVLTVYASVADVVIEGVTLVDGTSAGGAFEPGLGGCVLVFGSPILRELRLTGCTGTGAIYVLGGVPRLERVLLDANRGAAIAVGGITGAGGVVIEDTTVSGNDGRGLELVNFDGPGPFAYVYGSTFADNGGANLYVPIYSGAPTDFPLHLDHVVLSNEAPAVNCDGEPVLSELANLANDTSCALDAPGDLAGVDPLLGPLADNGGPTATHALLPGSPAIDGGESGCPGHVTDRTRDQRGRPRPQDGDADGSTRCDRGAFELPEPAGGAAAALLALAALAQAARRDPARHRTNV